MGKVIIHEQITVNGAFESPSPETWLELDTDSSDAALEQLTLADATGPPSAETYARRKGKSWANTYFGS